MNEFIKISLPIVGLIIGASLQFFFSRKNENRKQQNLLKTKAYTDFLKANSGISISQKFSDKEKEMEFFILLTDAKARICIYGSDSVINSIAEFERFGAILNDPKAYKLFTTIVSEMRNDNLKDKNTDLNDISQLILGENIE